MSSVTDMRQVLQFVAQKIHICIALERVERILSLVALKPVPLSPKYVTGILSLPGESIVVIDLAERLGLADDTPYTINTPILLCSNSAGRKTGLIVSRIIGVDKIQTEDIQLGPEFDEQTSPFTGVVNSANGPSLQLDVNKVLTFSIVDEEANIELEMNEHSLDLASHRS
jgi:purine-binding chemotaxis protein CheW